MTEITQETWRRKNAPRRFRFPWQLRVNPFTERAPLSIRVPDAENVGDFTLPTRELRLTAPKVLQLIDDARLSFFLAQQPLILVKNNALATDILALAAQYIDGARRASETPNSPLMLMDLIRERPEIDEKSAAFWYAMRPNKPQRVPNELDPETAQRLDFTRFLVQRGTFNEGFDEEDAPPQYRIPFSEEDLRSSDDDHRPPSK